MTFKKLDNMKKKNKIQGIIFDLGGVLLESFEFAFFEEVNKKFGISPYELGKIIQEEEPLVQIGKETDHQFWQKVCKKLNTKHVALDKALSSLWMKHYKQNAKIKKDTLTLVKQLRDKYKLAIISNTQKEHSAINRKRGLFDYFDVVLLSDEVGIRKPDKEIFTLASKKLGIPLRNLLYIDDEMRWVKVGRQLGLQSVLFKSAAKLEKALKELGIL